MKKDDRKAELIELVGEDAKTARLIEEVLFLEEKMAELKKLPFIAYNPKNPMQQKSTPAAKQYKEFLQQYNNSLRLLFRISGNLDGESEEESPLRKWVNARKELIDER